MECDFDILDQSYSLKGICTVNVIHRLIEASRLASGNLPPLETLRANVLMRIEQLNLKEVDKKGIVALAYPIVLDVHRYYAEMCGVLHRPTVIPQGIVEKERSVDAFLADEGIHYRLRFMIATNFSRLYHFSRLALNMTAEDMNYIIRRARSPLVEFWCRHISLFEVVDGNHEGVEYYPIIEKIFDEGFLAALEGRCDESMRIFLFMCSDPYLLSYSLRGDRMQMFLNNETFSPNTYCYAFRMLGDIEEGNASDSEERDEQFRRSYRVLIGLLQWPFQRYFLVAARELVSCDERLLSAMVPRIIDEVNSGRTDYDYRKLFFDFWHDFPKRWPRMMAIDNNFEQTVFNAALTKSKSIIELVIGAVDVRLRHNLMMEFGQSEQCMQLFTAKNYSTIKLVLAHFLSESRDTRVLCSFKCYFKARCFELRHGHWSFYHVPPMEDDERRAQMAAFDELTDDLKVHFDKLRRR